MTIVAKNQKSLIDQTAVKIGQLQKAGALLLPKNYSPETALKAAGLILADTLTSDKKPVLEACTNESIGNSLLKMVTLGLNPLRHCSFLSYGKKLACSINYQGKSMIAKRDGGVKSIVAQAVYIEDKFAFSIEAITGIKTVTSHEQTLQRTAVIGAYAVITMQDGSVQTEIMDIGQITKSWEQRPGQGLSLAHKSFPDEMAKKTVINRALKPIIESLDDSSLFYDEKPENLDKSKEDIKQEIKEQEFEEVEFDEVIEQNNEPEQVIEEIEEINEFDD